MFRGTTIDCSSRSRPAQLLLPPSRAWRRAAPRPSGYNTAQAPMVTFTTNPPSGAPANSTADAIISVGDTIGGYTFESIPDGVSVYPRGNGRADVFVNHETSTVPFPYNPPFGGPREANQNDFTNSEVSLLNVQPATRSRSTRPRRRSRASRTTSASARTTSRQLSRASSSRSCSRTRRHRTGSSAAAPPWPGPTSIPPGTAGAEQAGVVVAHDVKNGKTKPIYGMGRHNHENSRRDTRLRRARGALRRRHVPDEPAGVVAAVHVHGCGLGRALGRRGHAARIRRRRRRTTTTSTSRSARRSAGSSSPVPENIAKGKDPWTVTS